MSLHRTLLLKATLSSPSLAACLVFYCCWFWRHEVSVLFMWLAGLNNNLRSLGFKWFKTFTWKGRRLLRKQLLSPKVWTLVTSVGQNEKAANQLPPFMLSHGTPITHITAVSNPHLQALLLEHYNMKQQHRQIFLAQPFTTEQWGSTVRSWRCAIMEVTTHLHHAMMHPLMNRDTQGETRCWAALGQVWPWHLP